ncbi:MAG: endonuclease/exonuclease/phosphatase family protein [Gammaproteobacteria bacterium]|nr:endonuclease/exonuclease/phosphatase family protein [Gammaproteobacteria bacterium]
MRHTRHDLIMRVVTYNIQFGRGKDECFDIERIASETRGADIIAMQEVERFGERSGAVDQVAELVNLFPTYHCVYGPGLDLDASTIDEAGHVQNRRWQFGNLLMSRTPILSSRNHPLPKLDLGEQLSIQRSAIEGVVDCSCGPVRIYSVHLGHQSGTEREHQVARLLQVHHQAGTEGGVLSGGRDLSDWASQALVPPATADAILLGDFNAEPDSREYAMIVAAPADDNPLGGFVDAWRIAGDDADDGITDPSDGGARIDYAFVTTTLADRVRRAHVDQHAVGSDHQPLWLEIDL